LGGGYNGRELKDVGAELFLDVTEEEGGGLLVDTADITKGRHGEEVKEWRGVKVDRYEWMDGDGWIVEREDKKEKGRGEECVLGAVTCKVSLHGFFIHPHIHPSIHPPATGQDTSAGQIGQKDGTGQERTGQTYYSPQTNLIMTSQGTPLGIMHARARCRVRRTKSRSPT